MGWLQFRGAKREIKAVKTSSQGSQRGDGGSSSELLCQQVNT